MKKKVKKKMPTDIKVFIVVCVIITIIIGAAIVYIVKPKDIASVENSKITSDVFKYYYTNSVQNALAQFGSQSQDVNSFLNTPYGDTTLGDMIKQQTLSQVVQIEILLQEAKKENFNADKAKLDELWGYMEKSITQSASAYGKSVNDFCKEAFSVSFSKVKKINYDLYTTQLYMEDKIKAIAVDDAELASYYEENKASFDHNVVSHILILCAKDAEETTVTEKEKAAKDILEKVNAGGDFAALAKEFSEDPRSKDSGGVIQLRQDGTMVPEFEDWAFSHEIGDTGIVRTDHGFHVMRMDKINSSLEDQKENIKLSFQSEKFQTTIDEKLNSGEYNIEIKEGYSEF